MKSLLPLVFVMPENLKFDVVGPVSWKIVWTIALLDGLHSVRSVLATIGESVQVYLLRLYSDLRLLTRDLQNY